MEHIRRHKQRQNVENLKEKLPAAARPYRAVAGRWALGGGGRQE
jgi:hypothetical protein